MLTIEKRDRLLKIMAEAMDEIGLDLQKLKGSELIDTAARLNALRKRAETILSPDHGVKAHLWTLTGGKPGELLGNNFKAVLAVVPSDAIDVKKIRELASAGDRRALGILKDFSIDREQSRVDFKAR